jgi:hypothetical protein
MPDGREACLSRAAAARAEADAATLENVRERCLRSEAAWTEMADRAERNQRMRAKLAAEKPAATNETEIRSKPLRHSQR